MSGGADNPHNPLRSTGRRVDNTGMLQRAPAMTNAQRQERFRASHPGYFRKYGARRRALAKGLSPDAVGEPAAAPTPSVQFGSGFHFASPQFNVPAPTPQPMSLIDRLKQLEIPRTAR